MMIRKILITIVAAVAVSAAFVSCHRMDDVVYDPSNLKVNQYNAAFIQRYGEPAENHTWGFGTTRGNADGVTRSISTTIQFPGDAPADKFLSDVPEGVQRYDEVGQYGYALQGVSNAADIEVKVTYIDRSGTAMAAPASTFVLESNAGSVPQKIRVEPRFKLCAERQHIEAKYPLFRKYVSAPELEWY